MPQRYAMQNGRITLVGDDTAQDHVPPAPAAAAKAPTKPAKPSSKPTKPQAPWWQRLPHAVVNELRWTAKQARSLDAGAKLDHGLYRPANGNSKNRYLSPPSVRQFLAAVGPGAVQTAGEGLISMGQKLLAPTQFADPRQTVPGRALNALTRASYDALGAKQPEQLTEGQRGVIDNMGRSAGVEALALLLGRRAGAGIKVSGWTGRGLRWGTALGVSHGLSSVLQDSTQGNPLNLAFALAGKDAPKNWPGYFAPVDPIKDDRMGAAGKSLLPNLLFGEALGFAGSGAVRVAGKVARPVADKVTDFAAKGAAKEANAAWEKWAAGGFDPNQADRIAKQFTNIARWKRAARANVEHTSAWQKLEATGLVETVDGKQRFTEAARQKPAPVVQTAAEAEQALLDRYGMGGQPDTAPARSDPVATTNGADLPAPETPPAVTTPEPAAAPPPSQEMAMGGPVLEPEKPLPQGDPDLDPWTYDPALPEVADLQKVVSNMGDEELQALAMAGADGGPVLPQIEQAMSARPAPQPRPELSEGYAGVPTANLSELYLNGTTNQQGKTVLEPWSQTIQKIDPAALQDLANPEVSPQLAQKITTATGREWGNFTREDILDGLKALSADGTTILPNRTSGDVRLTPTNDLQVSPIEFQYKQGVNSKGEQLGNSLQGVTKWDPNAEQVVKVFTKPTDGKPYIVDGHNSKALAERLGVPTMLTQEVNATTVEGARAAGAISNISSGHGTPFDAAKFARSANMRTLDDVQAAGIPLKGDTNMWRQGVALGNLPDSLLQNAIDNRHRIGRYVALGEFGLDEAGMRAAHKALDQRPNMTEATFRELLDDADNLPTVKAGGDQTVLFGEEVLNPLLERAELVATVRAGLAKDKRLFGFMTKNADALSEAGTTTIDTAAAGQRVADAQQALALFDTLKKVSGPVGDLLNQGAARVAQGESLTVVARQIQREIGDSIELELANSGLKAKPDGSPLTERYRQEAMQVPGAEAKDYSPQVEAPPPPDQGQIPFSDGGQLGPLFNGPEPSRADLEAHAIQRAIANGEVRPSEMGPLELPAAPEADLDAALQELMGMDPNIPLEDQLPNMPAARQAAADELRLAAEHARRDAEMTWAAEQAAREAEGYHLKTLEQKKADGLGQEWFTPEADSRGQGRNFHGAADKITLKNGGEFGGDGMNIYGDGFYTTDDVATAAKYRKKNRGDAGSEAQPTVYEVTEKRPVKLFDLEKDDSPAVNALLNDMVAQGRYGADLVDHAIQDASTGTLGEIMDEMRAWSRSMEMPAYEVQEIFQEIIDTLQGEGYGGFTHTGGAKAGGGKRLHKVSIYWDPADAIGLKEMAPIPARPALIAAEVSGAPPFALPKELSKASPRYGRKMLRFESDLDRTAYMLFNDKAKGGSKAADKFREALAAAGFDPEQVAAHGKTVKAAIKAEARDTTSETVVVPVQQFGSDNPRLPLREQQQQISDRKAQIENIQRQINEGGCGT